MIRNRPQNAKKTKEQMGKSCVFCAFCEGQEIAFQTARKNGTVIYFGLIPRRGGSSIGAMPRREATAPVFTVGRAKVRKRRKEKQVAVPISCSS
jgi:hypothetical protein